MDIGTMVIQSPLIRIWDPSLYLHLCVGKKTPGDETTDRDGSSEVDG